MKKSTGSLDSFAGSIVLEGADEHRWSRCLGSRAHGAHSQGPHIASWGGGNRGVLLSSQEVYRIAKRVGGAAKILKLRCKKNPNL